MKPDNNYKKDVFKNLTLVTQLGIQMMTPIFLCLILGLVIDHYFHIHSVLVLLILGVLAGLKNMYMMAMESVNHSTPGKTTNLEHMSKQEIDRHGFDRQENKTQEIVRQKVAKRENEKDSKMEQ